MTGSSSLMGLYFKSCSKPFGDHRKNNRSLILSLKPQPTSCYSKHISEWKLHLFNQIPLMNCFGRKAPTEDGTKSVKINTPLIFYEFQ
jgi:hypothetical protein